MSNAQHTPGPWTAVPCAQTGYWIAANEHPFTIVDTMDEEGRHGGIAGDNAEANARLIAAAPELLEALEAYRVAHAMSSYGDYSVIEWESKAGPVNPAWGGGDCEKHGRWYGMCHCCRDEWKRLCEQSDRDAVRARNNALQSADEKARAAIAKATGGQ